MKSVAGTLKLDLSQYRELASFAQFGSDLDKTTQDTLARGAILTAILIQNERDPLPVEEQVAVIYAATNGYMSGVEADDVPDFEIQLRDNLRDSHGEILSSIRDEGKLTEENEESLKEAIKRFADNFEPEESTVQAGAAANTSEGSGNDSSENGDSENGSSGNGSGGSSGS